MPLQLRAGGTLRSRRLPSAVVSRATVGSMIAAGALLATSLLLSGCEVRSKDSLGRGTGSAREGEACTPGTGGCVGPAAAFVCIDGKYTRRVCTGPAGCVEARTGDTIDVVCSWEAGARCGSTEERDASCSPDGKTMLVCHGGEVRPEPCRGAEGCRAAAGKVRCDRSIARKGDTCEGDGGFACSEDGKEQLRCDKGVIASGYPCLGKAGCRVVGDDARCDMSIAAAGDACGDEVGSACSPDSLGYLECHGGKWTEKSRCGGAGKCAISDEGNVTCDGTVGAVGDACLEGSPACSRDGKRALECRDGKLADRGSCKCIAADGAIQCR